MLLILQHVWLVEITTVRLEGAGGTSNALLERSDSRLRRPAKPVITLAQASPSHPLRVLPPVHHFLANRDSFGRHSSLSCRPEQCAIPLWVELVLSVKDRDLSLCTTEESSWNGPKFSVLRTCSGPADPPLLLGKTSCSFLVPEYYGTCGKGLI